VKLVTEPHKGAMTCLRAEDTQRRSSPTLSILPAKHVLVNRRAQLSIEPTIAPSARSAIRIVAHSSVRDRSPS